MSDELGGRTDDGRSCVLGIDVGGTSIKAGLMSCEGELLGTTKIPTGSIAGQEAFRRIVEGLDALVAGQGRVADDLLAVGLDVPGPVDDEGCVGLLANIDLDADGLRAALREAYPGATLAFVNDANAAALGELWKGSGKGMGSFVMITLGTGVGAGVVVDGRLVAGAFGAAGEVGHLTVEPGEERVCGCGRRGCLEQYASAKGLVWLYRDRCARTGARPVPIAHATDAVAVFDAYREGDEAAAWAVGQMCQKLGFALAQVSAVVDPAVFLIGGGVAGAFDLFGEELARSFRSHCLAPSAAARILPCVLGNDAGMYGVAYEALLQRG